MTNVHTSHTFLNLMLKEFKYFSDAFSYGIDYLGLKHSDIYDKIGMDKGQFSNIYTGVVKNPQSSTRNKLTKFVDFEINRNGKMWELLISNAQNEDATHEPTTQYTALSLSAKRQLLDQVTAQLKEVVKDYADIRTTRILTDKQREITFDGITKRLQDVIKQLQ